MSWPCLLNTKITYLKITSDVMSYKYNSVTFLSNKITLKVIKVAQSNYLSKMTFIFENF